MELKKLKKGLFGFQKASVFDYISELNRVCSEKVEDERQQKLSALSSLNEKNEDLHNQLVHLEVETDALRKELQEKDAQLAILLAENTQLKNTADTQKTVETEVAELLADARRFALSLREKAAQEDEALRLENQKRREAEAQRIAAYGRDISAVKAAIDAVLTGAEAQLEQAETRIAALACSDDE